VTPINNPLGAGGGDILPNYWNPQRADPEIILPSSALEARLTAGLGAWGAWTVVQAATSQALVLVVAHMSKITTVSGSGWVQVGVDPAGGVNYAVRGEFAFHAFISGEGAAPIHTSTFRLAPYLVPAGSRVAMRGWVTGALADLSIQGYLGFILPAATWVDPWPNTYIVGGRATNQRRDPAVPGWYTVPQGAAWTQVIAAAPRDMLATAVEFDPSSGTGAQGEVVEMAVGAAGSELVFSRAGIPSVRLFGWAFGYQEFGRKALILRGEPVSLRKVAPFGGTHRIALYFEDL
jgi:hypothetical protein